MHEELRELWNNLDDANREECDKRAAEITSMLSGHIRKRGKAAEQTLGAPLQFGPMHCWVAME